VIRPHAAASQVARHGSKKNHLSSLQEPEKRKTVFKVHVDTFFTGQHEVAFHVVDSIRESPDGQSTTFFGATIPNDIWSVSKESIAKFKLTTWHARFPDFFIKLQRYTAIWKQLLISSDKNRVR
jgi:hypothetical protein